MVEASYIVHVWSGPDGFHAHARDVRNELGEEFADAFALARFFFAAQHAATDLAPPAAACEENKEPRRPNESSNH